MRFFLFLLFRLVWFAIWQLVSKRFSQRRRYVLSATLLPLLVLPFPLLFPRLPRLVSRRYPLNRLPKLFNCAVSSFKRAVSESMALACFASLSISS